MNVILALLHLLNLSISLTHLDTFQDLLQDPAFPLHERTTP